MPRLEGQPHRPARKCQVTIATLCYVLRVAVEGWEPYIWIVSDTKQQAQMHLENVKCELIDNELLAEAYPQLSAAGRHWRADRHRAPNRRRDRSLRHGPADPRPPAPRASADADRLRRPAKRQPHRVGRQREASRHGSTARCSRPARRTPTSSTWPPPAPRSAGDGTARAAGWTSAVFAAIESWPTNTALWDEWEAIYCDADKSDCQACAARILRAASRRDGRRRRRALARGRRPVHADADARRERPHRVRARKARLADRPGAVRVARIVLRRSHLVRRVAERARGACDRARSQQGKRRPPRRLLGLRAAGHRSRAE